MNQAQPVAPLTIVAIFAGIIEASALATLPFLSEASQTLYTWFLVGFPFFLTALFFLTLNFNYKSFYTPAGARTESVDSAQSARKITSTTLPTASAIMHGEPMTFMFSGPEASQLMEKELLHALAQAPEPARTWQFCNVPRGQCVRLSVSPLE